MARIAHRVIRPLAFIIGLAGFSSGAAAQSNGPLQSSAVSQHLASRLSAGMTLGSYLQNLRFFLRELDADGSGDLSAADVEMHVAASAASLRSEAVMRLLRHDLDGDGVVTADELRLSLNYQARNLLGQTQQNQVESQFRNLIAADADRDGRITFEEALGFARSRPTSGGNMAKRVQEVLELADDGSKMLPLARFEAAGEAIFIAADTDKDEVVSAVELQTYRSRFADPSRPGAGIPVKEVETARAGCTMPRASEGARVVLLSAYETDALSTVTIGSQDVVTRTGSIAVGAGKEPLFIVVVSHDPIIWRLTGSVERVERLVLAATSTEPSEIPANRIALAGATGLAADRITFLAHGDCLHYFTEARSSQAATVADHVRRESGREIAMTAAANQVSGFEVPSGLIRTTARPDRPSIVIAGPGGILDTDGKTKVIVQVGRRDLASDVARFYPGGIVEVDPAKVVASRPVQRYGVLPNQAGLQQLVQSGALERNSRGEFVIKQKMRFPAGLYGGHSVRFLLLRGVPMPEGNPGHSCVIVESIGKGGEGANC